VLAVLALCSGEQMARPHPLKISWIKLNINGGYKNALLQSQALA
jgi:hypothetical protein